MAIGEIQEMVRNGEAPKSLLKTTKMLRSSDAEKVLDIERMNRQWMAAETNARDRMFESLEGFMDIDQGSWDPDDRQELLRTNRHVASMNIAKQKMETLSGSFLSEKYDYYFTPVNTEESSLTQGIRHWYFQDKDDYDYNDVYNGVNLDGLLHAGTCEMIVDYSVRPTGAIGLIKNQMGSVLKDPYWQSDRYKDWRRAIKQTWMTPDEIIEKYHTDDEHIHNLAMLDDLHGFRYESDGDNVAKYQLAPQKWGSKLLVIEYRWLETIQTTRLYVRRPDGNGYLALPLKIKESDVRTVIQLFGVSWEDVKEFPYSDDVLNIRTIAPYGSRTAILAEGKHNVQCGSIAFFRFSSTKHDGIEKGMMEYILDIQRSFNYRQAKIDDTIASSASGGIAYDKNLIAKEDAKDLKTNKTRPDFAIGVDGSPANIFSLLPVGQVPEHLFRDVYNLIDMFDRVSPVTPALEGAAQKDESGVLFQMRHAVTKLGTLRMMENWRQFLLNIAEAWYYQAQITYKGIYRKVPVSGGMGSIEFNVPDFSTGKRVMINSVETLPRAKVIVSLSQSSPTEQMAKRLQYQDLSNIYSAHPDLFKAEIRQIGFDLLKTMDLPPEDKSHYEKLHMLHKQGDLLEAFGFIENNKAGIMQNKAMAAQFAGMLKNLQAQEQAFDERMNQGTGAPLAIDEGQPDLGAQQGPPPEPPLPSGNELSVDTSRGTFTP